MHNLRKYGNSPHRLAVIHGGPGARGEMAPVARELARERGVLEPLQTATSLDDQVAELLRVLENHGVWPMTLLGFSWGAWLAYLVAARYPALVDKLILVGSGPLEAHYAQTIGETRLARLPATERHALKALIAGLDDPHGDNDEALFARIGTLCTRADAYDPMKDTTRIDFDHDQFRTVWPEAASLRRSGDLLKLGKQIRCPVVAIHGDHDPHPALGVQGPLTEVLSDFRFYLLAHCGHKPWIERQARDRFFEILKKELF